MTAGHPDRVVDVLVVGGGPTGMTAAGDLARAGRTVVVLERWPQVNPASRAFGTMARTLEVLDARGLAEDLLATGTTAPQVRLFGGAAIDLTHLPSRYPFVLVTPQTHVDRALAGYAVAQGAEVHRGTEVVALDQDDDGVTVTTRPKDDDDPAQRRTWRARYVIGADGAHSTVRERVGAAFPGRALLSSLVLADVLLADPPAGEGLLVGSTPDAFAFLAPYGRAADGGAWFRAITWDRRHQVPDTEPVADGETADVLRRALGRDVGVLATGWRSRFHCEERQVERYRWGRVLLAGDAAHVHAPTGGQGMNTGIQDAANLAWKLDAVLGGAPDAVLDSYHDERHPVGRRVVRQSGLLLRGVTLHRRPARWLRDHLAPALLGVPRVRDVVAGSFAGTGLRYRRRRGEHRLVGTRAAGVPLAGGRLTVRQRDGGWVLVQPPGAAAVPGLHCATRADGGPALLVRPDGHVAWAGSGDGWVPVLQRWTGSSRTVAAAR